MEMVIATYNIGKIREYRNLFTDSLISISGLTEFPDVVEVAETGKTFSENAALKAAGYARQTGKWVIADDSGLEVTALGGRPGIFSARYAGADSDYTHKMAVLLNEIFESGSDDRSARFVCSIAVANENGVIKFIGEGECRGSVAREARGTNGFGYDPVFIPSGFDRTFGEIPDNVKRRISHRAKALETILRYLRDFTAV